MTQIHSRHSFNSWMGASVETRKRVKRLLSRGFDVPPSKEKDFRVLIKAGYRVAEAGKALSLE